MQPNGDDEGSDGSATEQGELWGARARDWAQDQEPLFAPLYKAALDMADCAGQPLLDIGCGAGRFCTLAAERGAQVHGLDAAAALVEIARERVPSGSFTVGEMEQLPYPENSFEIVTAFNALGHAADRLRALGEAARVGRPGALLAVSTWGAPEACDATAIFQALEPLRGRHEAGARAPTPARSLEELLPIAGFEPVAQEDVGCPWIYPDAEAALRGLMSAGPFVRVAQVAGEVSLRETLLEALAPFRRDGGYRLENKFVLVAARAT